MYAIAKGDRPGPELPAEFSKEARDFFRLCLVRNPDQRPSANQLLEHKFLKQIDSTENNLDKNIVKKLKQKSTASKSNNRPCSSREKDIPKDSKAASSGFQTKKSNN